MSDVAASENTITRHMGSMCDLVMMAKTENQRLERVANALDVLCHGPRPVPASLPGGVQPPGKAPLHPDGGIPRITQEMHDVGNERSLLLSRCELLLGITPEKARC